MPFGTLPVNGNAVPQFAPPYTINTQSFSDVTLITIPYRVTAASIRHLVPDVLELEDEPLVSAMLVDYGMSTVGAYTEYVHSVEVTYKGKVFGYYLSLIMNNDSSIFCGREQYGYPKRLGHVSLDTDTGSHIVRGHVERPVGQKIVNFDFAPSSLLPTTSQTNPGLNLRVIPSALPNQPPSVKELVPAIMDIKPKEIYGGTGFSATSQL
ncbi:Decarboxylase DEC1 [Penicillium digitatum Pd1]|uniref:Decarboxylase DEC1 n=1 Tax=Penicillium digitatum (strain Pd1 / CECT 20795) TaxID=1170230 RepID=K9G7D8_PEND1|nr:Decarboxylase DEC1 [Penicillium digitatum Pd1]EKV17845.1 Decarboxylase DEC1 [Penicillium digitatum Pd1]